MKFTIRKLVLNAMTVPNPIQYTKSGKCIIKTKQRNSGCYMNSYSFCYFLALGEDLRCVFDEMDADASGAVDLEEFQVMVQAHALANRE